MSGVAARVARVAEGAGAAELADALASDAAWLWFVAARGRPRADALACLLAATESEAGDAAPAVVLAGLLVDEQGAPLDDAVQAAPRIDAEAAVRLVGRRMLPIRSASLAHCLVARAALGRHGVPDPRRFGPFAAQEWTARVLRDEPGYLVPASVMVVPGPGPRAERVGRPLHLGAAIRMLSTGTWSRGDAARALGRALAGRPPP